jgi:hypothetical protein
VVDFRNARRTRQGRRRSVAASRSLRLLRNP